MANNHSEIEKRLWASADELRANSKLKSSEYSVPVLGLIFLRYADFKFAIAEKELAGKGSGRRAIGKEDYQAKGVMFLPPEARFSRRFRRLRWTPREIRSARYTNTSWATLPVPKDRRAASSSRPRRWSS